MTTLNGPILFNNSTGSDTLSSGLGPSTAINGSGASTSAASAIVTGIDTTGVSAGDVLWVQSSSGRQFSVIASVDSGTQVTCDNIFDNTEGSRNWAIGGKRAGIDSTESRKLFADMGGHLTEYELEDTGSAYTVTSTISWPGGSSYITLRGNVSTRVVVSFNANDKLFSGSAHMRYENLHLKNTNVTKTASVAINKASAVYIYLDNCSLDQTDNWYRGLSYTALTSNDVTIVNSDISYCVDSGVFVGYNNLTLFNSKFTNNGSFGITGSGISAIGCVFANNTGDGLVHGGNPGPFIVVTGCVFYNNGGDGLDLENESTFANIVGNVFVDNGLYSIRDAYLHTYQFFGHNGFMNSGTADHYSTGNDATDITLTEDPFIDAANGNFNLNNAAGGGALLRAIQVAM